VIITSDGKIVGALEDGIIKIWTAVRPQVSLFNMTNDAITLKGHTRDVTCCVELSNKLLMSGSDDGTIKLWNLETTKCITTFNHNGACKMIQILSNGKIVSATSEGEIYLWKKTKEILSSEKIKSNVESIEYDMEFLGHQERVWVITEMYDGNLISCSDDATIRIWNITTGNCEKILVGHGDRIYCMSILPDKRIISGSNDGTIKIWNSESGTCESTFNDGQPIHCLDVLPSGCIMYGCRSRTLKILY